MKKYILSIIFCLWASCAWAFPPGFIGAVTQGADADGYTLILNDTLYASDYIAIESYTVTPGPGGPWASIQPGILVYTDGARGTSSSSYSAITPDVIGFGYIIINAKTGYAAGTRVVAIGLQSADTLDNTKYDGYTLSLDGLGTLTLRRVDDSVLTLLDTTTCTGHDVNTHYDIKLTRTVSGVTGEVVGQNCTVTSSDTTYQSGSPYIGISNTASRITDFKAYENN